MTQGSSLKEPDAKQTLQLWQRGVGAAMEDPGDAYRLGALDVLLQVVDEDALRRGEADFGQGELEDLRTRLVEAHLPGDHDRVEQGAPVRHVVARAAPRVGDHPGAHPGVM